MNRPYFSVIIPTYNRADFIGQTIASVLKQDFEDFELIIVDDGSTDNTKEVVAGIEDKRIRYYKKENAERGAARNFGAKKAGGEYLNFLDSDDLLNDNHLSTAYKIIQEEKSLLFALHYNLSVNGKIKKANYLPVKKVVNESLVKVGNFLSCNAVFIHSQIFKENNFNEKRALAGSEDYELWLRLASRYSIYYYPKITSTIVFHEDRSVVSMSSKKIIQRKELMLSTVFNDQKFIEKYASLSRFLHSNTNTYLALHLAILGEKKRALRYLITALKLTPLCIFKKRTLAIVGKLLF
jgi:glycosyltransferase involved in cell wall biosynthesis